MSSIILPKTLDREEKIAAMREDAKFEVASDSDAETTALLCAEGIKGKAAPPKIPKLFLASHCVFNCAYCGCRCGRENRDNYCSTPRELASLAVDAAKNNGHGVFVTSAIYKNADYTQELIAESVRIMREEQSYAGFIHAKVMPGADPLLISRTGKYANRLSVNIEVAQSVGYARIAKQKNKDNILTPMKEISEQIAGAKYEKAKFAVSQTTQLMAGSTGEDDRVIMTLSKALYHKFRLKRVYYTAFQYRHDAKGYESENLPHVATPYWRMARLYQADRLLTLYGFTPDDVTPAEEPFLSEDIDPKAAWALRHMDMYPVEVNTADYEALIRVPGIGITYANRIIAVRRHCNVTHDIFRKLGIPQKKCRYFITCGGKYEGGDALFSEKLRGYLSSGCEQLSITDTLAADETQFKTTKFLP